MNKSKLTTALVLTIIVSPIIYLLVVYSKLPQVIAVHFGADGKADDFGDKSTLWVGIIIMSGVSAGLYFLLKNIHKIDPKKSAAKSKGALQKLAFAIVLSIAALNFLIIQSTASNQLTIRDFPILGLLFAYLGNIMYSVKPNYFVGIRTPWALENEDNWRKTHQLAGKLWFAGGILIAILTFFMQSKQGMVAFSIVFIITVIPVVYSYLIFRQQRAIKN